MKYHEYLKQFEGRKGFLSHGQNGIFEFALDNSGNATIESVFEDFVLVIDGYSRRCSMPVNLFLLRYI